MVDRVKEAFDAMSLALAGHAGNDGLAALELLAAAIIANLSDDRAQSQRVVGAFCAGVHIALDRSFDFYHSDAAVVKLASRDVH